MFCFRNGLHWRFWLLSWFHLFFLCLKFFLSSLQPIWWCLSSYLGFPSLRILHFVIYLLFLSPFSGFEEFYQFFSHVLLGFPLFKKFIIFLLGLYHLQEIIFKSFYCVSAVRLSRVCCSRIGGATLHGQFLLYFTTAFSHLGLGVIIDLDADFQVYVCWVVILDVSPLDYVSTLSTGLVSWSSDDKLVFRSSWVSPLGICILWLLRFWVQLLLWVLQ